MIIHNTKCIFYFQKLKDLVWGSSQMPPRPEWIKQGLEFYPYEQIFAYALQFPRNGVKNFLMCFQAYLLKHLLFGPSGGAGARGRAFQANR